MPSDPTPCTDTDRDYIAKQLGPGTAGVRILAVAARDAQGRPAVLLNHPLRQPPTPGITPGVT